MNLDTLKPRPGAKHRRKRLGSGESSGHGKTCGKGNKGQKARSGGSIRPGFEGGQMPLIRRLPKRGFSNAQFSKCFAIVNVGQLNDFADGTTIDEAILRGKKLIRGRFDGVKILGNGELSRKLTIKANKVSAAAKGKIERVGGTVDTASASASTQKKA